MDLGIAGRKAIVCASSRGLGKACARALAEAGCEVTINGRDAKRLKRPRPNLRSPTSAKITAGRRRRFDRRRSDGAVRRLSKSRHSGQ